METQPALTLTLSTADAFPPPQQVGQALSALSALSVSYSELYSQYRKAMHLLGNILIRGEMVLSAEEVETYAREVIVPLEGSPKEIVVEELEDRALKISFSE